MCPPIRYISVMGRELKKKPMNDNIVATRFTTGETYDEHKDGNVLSRFGQPYRPNVYDADDLVVWDRLCGVSVMGLDLHELRELQHEKENKMYSDGKDRYDDRQEKQKYLSKSMPHHNLLTSALTKVSLGLVREFEEISSRGSGRTPLWMPEIKDLDLDLLSFIGLNVFMDSVGSDHGKTINTALNKIGRRVQAEVFARDLKKHGKREFTNKKGEQKTYNYAAKIIQEADAHSTIYGEKLSKAYSLAKQENFPVQDWPAEKCVHVATPIYNAVLAYSDLFKIQIENTSKNTKKYIMLLPQAQREVDSDMERQSWMSPMWGVMLCPPNPWTSMYSGCYLSEKMSSMVRLVKEYTYAQEQSVRYDFELAETKGELPKYAEAVNALQNVPLKVNTKVVEVVNWCWSTSQVFPKGKKFPSGVQLDELPRLDSEQWKTMDKPDRQRYQRDCQKIRQKNSASTTASNMMRRDLDEADSLGTSAFWIPWNLDYRGRMYPLSNFNYHRDDHIKSMFLLYNGCLLTMFNDHWLKIHIANTGGFDRIDKQPLMDRVHWVDDNQKMLLDCAADPKGTFDIWSKADKPFQFLAGCFEWLGYCEAKSNKQGFVSHLSPSLDGSNSGCQHYSAASLSEETGKLVNLVPDAIPQDVYQVLCDRVIGKLNLIINDPESSKEDKAFAANWLLYGLTRKHVKTNCMTYVYSSVAYGFKDQIMSDIMEMEADILYKNPNEGFVHPFGNEENQRLSAHFLAKHSYACVQDVLVSARHGMDFFRGLVSILAKENKPMDWRTPIGFPVVQKYTKINTVKIKPFLYDMSGEIKVEYVKVGDVYHAIETPPEGAKKRTQISVKVTDKKDICMRQSKQGVSPNIIHSYDASHMMSTILELKKQGITDMMMIHDSFAVLCDHSWELFSTVRETFIEQYTDRCIYSDILGSVSKRVNGDNLEKLREFELPPKGHLDLSVIRKSDYCFA